MNHQYQDREPKEGWRLDKKVPLSLIFAMLVQAGMFIWAIADIKKDVEVLKMGQNQQQHRDDRKDNELAGNIVLLRNQLERMDNKLDRVLEKTR